jgi:hypothetical protein
VDALVQQLPQIITAAAQSTLGILALLVVALSALAYVFFARASEKARIGVFVLLFAGVAAFAVALMRAAPAGVTPIAHAAGLSTEAQVLLREAAADEGGMVTYVHYGAGSEMTANDRNLLPDQSPRTLATWEGALKELLDAGLVSANSPDAEIFRVTREGFEAAKRLPAP